MAVYSACNCILPYLFEKNISPYGGKLDHFISKKYLENINTVSMLLILLMPVQWIQLTHIVNCVESSRKTDKEKKKIPLETDVSTTSKTPAHTIKQKNNFNKEKRNGPQKFFPAAEEELQKLKLVLKIILMSYLLLKTCKEFWKLPKSFGNMKKYTVFIRKWMSDSTSYSILYLLLKTSKSFGKFVCTLESFYFLSRVCQLWT